MGSAPSNSVENEEIGNLDMHEIRPNLYLGSYQAAKFRAGLKKTGISHILTVISKSKRYSNDFTYKSVNISDHKDACLGKYFHECCLWIDECLKENKKVLVHCFAGASRSASVIVAYLMWKEHLAVENAVKQVQEIRSVVQPNPGFMKQLHHFKAANCSEKCDWTAFKEREVRFLRMRYVKELSRCL